MESGVWPILSRLSLLLAWVGAVSLIGEAPKASAIDRAVGVTTETIGGVTPSVGQAAEISDVKLGIAGHMRLGSWNELRVSGSGFPENGVLVIRAVDGDSNQAEYRWPLVAETVQAGRGGGSESCVGWFRVGRVRQSIEIVLETADGSIAAKKLVDTGSDPSIQVHSANDRLWLYMGPDLNLGGALGWSADDRQPGSYRLVAIESVDDLPITPWGWESVERFVGCADPQQWPTEWSEETLTALYRWLASGGRMSIAISRDRLSMFQGEGAWAELLSGLTGSSASTQDSSQIELLVTSRSQLIRNPRSESLPYVWWDYDREESALLIDGQPVLFRRSLGLGQVDVLGLNLTDPLLEQWPSRPSLLAKWLDYKRPEDARLSTALGYSDVTGRLRSALEQFTRVRLISFTSVALIVLGFVGLLAADYFFLKHVVGRMQWTWLTVPTYCLVAGVATWGVFRSAKPDVYQVNQAELIDIDATGVEWQLTRGADVSAPSTLPPAVVRGKIWLSLYSPDAGQLDLGLHSQLPWNMQAGSLNLGWLGLPGRGIGGMESDNQWVQTAKPYRYVGSPEATSTGASGPSTDLQDVPFYVASTRVLRGSWTATLPPVQSTLKRKAGRDRVNGTIRNPLPVTLTDCFIIYGGWAYRLNRPLGPDDVVDLDVGKNEAKPESLEDWLRRPNPDPDDLHRALEWVMYHDLAGGRTQTRLLPGYQHRLDLSHLARLDRAVLLGRCESTVARLCVDGEPLAEDKMDHTATAVRIILPVSTED